MVTTFPKIKINEYQETTFIAGTYRELYFYVTDSSGNPINVTYSTPFWKLYRLGYPEHTILSKYGEPHDGYFLVKLLSSDTLELSGKFKQIATLGGISAYETRVGQGLVNIIPAIGGNDE